MRKAAFIVIMVGLSAATVLLVRWRSGSSAPIPNERPTHVILITIDTLRADHLSCYGYARPTSPNMDRLAADSTVFDNAVTPSPTTGPSIASMMTSSYSYHHGVVNNYFQLHNQNTTLAETLKQHDYETAAFVSNYVLVRELSNLQQGFDVYDDYLSEKEANRDIYERSATRTVNLAIAWLRQTRTNPFFLWVHLMDPHGPYMPPSPFDERFTGEPEPLPREVIPNYQFLGTTDRSVYVSRYDGEIAYCDGQIGRLLDVLQAAGIYDESLIILHADHGESLGENGSYFEHGVNLFEPCLRVPLMVKLPHSPAKGSGWQPRCDALVTVMDIAPTILDVIGCAAPPSYEGISLRAVLAGKVPAHTSIFVEAHMSEEEGGEQIGIRTPGRKLITRLDSRRSAKVEWEGFYSVSSRESVDREVSDPGVADGNALREILANHCKMLAVYRFPFKRTHYRPESGSAFMERRNQEQMDDADRRRYQALNILGYVE